jgi:type I restriction enzyme, S subunit
VKKVREGYKMTKLGEIPEKWYISKLSELAQIKRGASPRPINNPKWFSEKKNVGWIRISDVTKTKKYLNSTEQYLSDEGVAKSRLVRPNDIIMSICATVGKPIILNIDACIHDGFILFDDLNNNKIITDYLYYLLQKKEEEFKGMGQTGTQANLNTNIVGSTLIAIPTIEEQKKIALILSIVDEQIDNVDELIQKNKELKKGLMQQLLTKGIGHTKFKKTEIGEIPYSWRVTSFKEISKVSQGLQISIEERYKDFKVGRLPYITIQYINDKSNQDNEYFIENYSDSVVCNKDDILMTRTGNTGIVVTNEIGVFHNNFFKVDFRRDLLNKDFLVYFFNTTFMQSLIIRYAGTTTIPDLKHGDFYKLPVVIPSIEEQKQIASILSEVDIKIEEYENKKQKLQEFKKGLMQQLLTGNIRVI